MTGVCEASDLCVLEDIYFAAGWGRSVVNRVEVSVKLEEVVVVL